MNYKAIIRSRNLRIRILSLLSFIPDRPMVKMQYYIKTGRKLNLDNPTRLTEKLQEYKLFYRDPLMKQCVDKYDVRKYVAEKGYPDSLIPVIGVYDNPEEVVFDSLPNKFVAKDTLGGGGCDVRICRDKTTFDLKSLEKDMKDWVHKGTSYKIEGREWPYGGKKHRIIIEQLLEADENKGGLIDYKFFCFNGKFEFLYVIADRKLGDKAGFAIFDKEFRKLNVTRNDEAILSREIPKPDLFDDMIKMAENLSSPFPHARIDLYYHQNKIYFGEITFFNGSGYMTFTPDTFDNEAGSLFDLTFMRESKYYLR